MIQVSFSLIMNAWVFRHLDELRRIYSDAGVAVDEPKDAVTGEHAPSGPFPGAVERYETPDGLDVILTPGKRRPRPDR